MVLLRRQATGVSEIIIDGKSMPDIIDEIVGEGPMANLFKGEDGPTAGDLRILLKLYEERVGVIVESLLRIEEKIDLIYADIQRLQRVRSPDD